MYKHEGIGRPHPRVEGKWRTLRGRASGFAILTIAVATTAAAPRVQAGQITQTQGFVEKKTNFSDASTLTFDRFDDLGGARTLIGVDLVYEQTLRADITIPTPPTGAVITVRIGNAANRASLRTEGALGLSFDPHDPLQTSLLTSHEPLEIVWSFLNGSAYHQAFTTSSQAAVNYSDPLALALFVGSTPFTLSSFGQSKASYSSSTGSGAAFILTSADVRVSLVYTFTALPEPSSIALLATGSGLGAIALWRRRRELPGSPTARTD